ncbi:MAG: ABC transporter permease [Saprospiraceae bacterium]
MDLKENIKVALQSVRNNMLRAVLTIIIIAVGITALIGILTAIDVAIYSLNDNFGSLGASSFSIYPSRNDGARGRRNGRQSKRGEPITFDQAMDFKERFDFPADVSISMFGTGLASIKHSTEKTNPNVRVRGIDNNYVTIKGMEISHGRNFSSQEVQNGSNKVLIGMDIVNALFNKKPDKALQQAISIGNVKYKVIGVLKSRGSSLNSSEDRVAYIPLLNCKRLYGTQKTNYAITVAPRSAEDITAAESTTIGLFRNIRGLRLAQENDFQIFKSDGLITFLKDNTVKLRLAAVAIGLMTLLGAAIGLMNIMLVSVTERTREIGICKAIGATKNNILIQFLTEAIVICQIGGIIGIVVGILIGNAVTFFMGGSFVIPWPWIFVGVATCMVVGLASGLYPALKASRLDPIESLRYE